MIAITLANIIGLVTKYFENQKNTSILFVTLNLVCWALPAILTKVTLVADEQVHTEITRTNIARVHRVSTWSAGLPLFKENHYVVFTVCCHITATLSCRHKLVFATIKTVFVPRVFPISPGSIKRGNGVDTLVAVSSLFNVCRQISQRGLGTSLE
jgi:hypothetical protein